MSSKQAKPEGREVVEVKMNLCKQVVINWELAYSAAAFAFGNAPPSTNLSEFVKIQRVAPRLAATHPAEGTRERSFVLSHP